MNILELKNIAKYFPIKKGILKKEIARIKAVDGVSLSIKKGEVFSLVGESGCGKSTLARIIARLIPPDTGEIIFQNKNITQRSHRQMLPIRSKMQMVFQDPYSSLDPLFNIYSILKEAIELRRDEFKEKKKHNEKIKEVLKKVKLPEDSLYRFPHQFSGGERQRIAIARSLITEPEFLILDEPISSLDVLVQTQILELLKELKDKFSLSYLFISHNLRVVRKIAERIAVMYLGRIVELATSESLFNRPYHPYTYGLIEASFFKPTISGEPLSNVEEIKGCVFKSRCAYKKSRCEEASPELQEKDPGHFVACHFPLNVV